VSKDLYETLGVDRKASQDEIRKAYRKLAKDLHPDLHPGDKKAEERFKDVSAAYKILNDAKTRARYDKGELDETGAERPAHEFYRHYADQGGTHHYYSAKGFEDIGDIGDIFSNLFGGAGPGARGREEHVFRMGGGDVRYRLVIDFMEAVKGTKKRVTMPDGATLDVTIPAGIENGGILRLKGKGMPGIGGGPAGDALVEVTVTPHKLFRRDGNNIVIDLPITVDEAVLGAKVRVPTISGSVTMTIPKGAGSGSTLRLRGKGVDKPGKGTAKGDQLVRLQIVLPERIDPELEDFMKHWRNDHPYNPRLEIEAMAA
jgi:DnaJ-class molecular chaperone